MSKIFNGMQPINLLDDSNLKKNDLILDVCPIFVLNFEMSIQINVNLFLLFIIYYLLKEKMLIIM